MELFGFEKDEWVVIDGVMVNGGYWVGLYCGSSFCFEIFFIWVCLRFDGGWLFGLVELCLIVLCDIGSKWVDLDLIIDVVRFFFFNVL